MSMPDNELYEYAIREYNGYNQETVTSGWSTYDHTHMQLVGARQREADYVAETGNPLLYTYKMLRRPKNTNVEVLDV